MGAYSEMVSSGYVIGTLELRVHAMIWGYVPDPKSM